MDLSKTAGAHCPKCGSKPAEFRGMHEAFFRWRCSCGAAGRLISIGNIPPAPAAVKAPHPHWTTKRT